MNTYEKLYSKLRTTTDRAILDPIKSLDAEKVSDRESENQWSLAQIAHHLVLVEQRILNSAKNAELSKKELPILKLVDDLRMFFFGLIILAPIKVKVPVKEVLPDSSITKEEIVALYDQTQAQWTEFLASQSSTTNQAILKHPIAGWMNLSHALVFMSKHLQHHLPQIKAALRRLESS